MNMVKTAKKACFRRKDDCKRDEPMVIICTAYDYSEYRRWIKDNGIVVEDSNGNSVDADEAFKDQYTVTVKNKYNFELGTYLFYTKEEANAYYQKIRSCYTGWGKLKVDNYSEF